ncbi:MAG: hypothetical protein QW757_02515 [Candidatus Woesearchaeota archaeon]
MLYKDTNPEKSLYQIIDNQISIALCYLNERFEAGKKYVEQRYNNLASYYIDLLQNFTLFYDKFKFHLSPYSSSLENLIYSFRVLFSKQNQGTIKMPGNGHAGNSKGKGSKKPTATPDKRKGGQNGQKQK